jgi:hypothetical protein
MNSPAPASGAPPAGLPAHFSRLVGSNLAAQSAEQLSLAAVPLVAVLMLGSGAGEIGLLAAWCRRCPSCCCPFRFGRAGRPHLAPPPHDVGRIAARRLAGRVLLAMVLTGQLSIFWLAVVGFAGAVGTVGFSVAAPAMVPALVPRGSLARANGRLELARSAAYAAGPALAGALVAWVGGAASLRAGRAAVGRGGGAVAGCTSRRAPWRRRATRCAEMQEGAQFVWRHEYLRKPMLLTGIAWNIAWFVLQAAYVPYAVRVLGLNAERGRPDAGHVRRRHGGGRAAGASGWWGP